MPLKFNPFSGNFDFTAYLPNWLKQKLTKEPNGFLNRTDTALSFVDATRTFTITGTNFTVFSQGTQYTKNTESIQIPNLSGLYFIYYDGSGVLTYSASPVAFYNCLVVTIYWNSVLAQGRVADERHGIVMDWNTHEYLHRTIGARYRSGFAGTFTDTTLSIALGQFDDEDLNFSIAAQTQCRVLYKDGDTNYKWTAKQNAYYYSSGGSLYYNNGNVLTAVPANQYVAYWIFVSNDIETPIYALMGQRVDTTLANARLNNTYESLALGTLPFAEMKVLYRVILRNDATPYEEVQDLRSISNLPAGTYVATDHGALTGLADPDHPASAIVADTTNFNKNLTTADDTVQKALDTIDNLSLGSAALGTVRSISSTLTLRPGIDTPYQFVNVSTSYPQAFVLSTSGAANGHYFVIRNISSITNEDHRLTTTNDEIYPGDTKIYFYDGTAWRGVSPGALYEAIVNPSVMLGTKSGATSYGVGVGTSALGYGGGIAVGYSSSANNYGVAVGYSASGATTSSVSIGHNATSNGKSYSINLGYGATALRAAELTKRNQGITGNQGIVTLGKQTTDATPTHIWIFTDTYYALQANSFIGFTYTVVAFQKATFDCKMWKGEGAIKRNGTNVTSLVGTPSVNVVAQEAGAAAWGIAITADDTTERLVFTATGEAAKTILWSVRVDFNEIL